MTDLKQAIEGLRGAKMASFTVKKATEEVLNVILEKTQEQADELARKNADVQMKLGHQIVWRDGTVEFICTVADFVDHEHVFALDGDRIRCLRKLVTIKNGERTERVLRIVWKNFDKYYEEN